MELLSLSELLPHRPSEVPTWVSMSRGEGRGGEDMRGEFMRGEGSRLGKGRGREGGVRMV